VRRAAALAGACLVACGPGAPEVQPTARHAILIVVDTLRADHLGTYGYGRPTSPRLDRWAETGRVFENAQSTSPWTLPSFASMLTGHLPTRHGATAKFREGGIDFFALDASVSTVAEVLRDAGLRTGAVVNNPFLARSLDMHRGFEHYDHEKGNNRESRRADVMVDRALRWIDEVEGEPFFLLLHLFDPHVKYDAPRPWRGKFTAGIDSELSLPMGSVLAIRAGEIELDDGDRDFVAAAYDEELAFVDDQLDRFRRELEARGLLEDALVILTSDHGEELFEHGGFEHGHAMWQELLRVPFIAWGPGVRPGREAAAISVTDVAATLLEGLGIDPERIEGRSLWPNLVSAAPLSERLLISEQILHGDELQAGVRWPLKVVVDPGSGSTRVFDLEADPGETEDLRASRASEAAALEEALGEALGRAARERLERSRTEMDPAVVEQLRALGYAE